jgi:uncharacterized protein with PhoU and TrkA domain
MDARPRNLRAMLAESKDLSELMVVLASAALVAGASWAAAPVRGTFRR